MDRKLCSGLKFKFVKCLLISLHYVFMFQRAHDRLIVLITDPQHSKA